METLLDSKDTTQVSADCSQVEPKQLEMNHLKDTQGLLIANGGLKNIGLENNKVGHKNMLLSSLSLPDPSSADQKIAGCVLFSNKLTETVLGEIKLSDANIANGSTTKDPKLVENIKLNNAARDTEVKIGNSGPSEANLTDSFHLDPTFTPPPEPLLTTKTSSRHSFCLVLSNEFEFLKLDGFLILSLSFLFLAYGCSGPVVYLVPYALSLGVGHQKAAFLMSIFGVSGIVGNITFGWIMDRQ